MNTVFQETQQTMFVHPAWRIVGRLDGIVCLEFESAGNSIWYVTHEEDSETWDNFDMGVWQWVYLPPHIYQDTADELRWIFGQRLQNYSYAMAHQSTKNAIEHARNAPESEWIVNWLERVALQIGNEWIKYQTRCQRSKGGE